MIISSLYLALNFAFIAAGFLHPTLFALVILGQVFGGISTTFLWSASTSLAQLWFPESQIGLATGISMTGISTGAITGYLLPSNLVYFQSNASITTPSNRTTFENENWIQHNKTVYCWLFLLLLISSVLVLILLITIVPKLPKLPPSVAQYIKRLQNENQNHQESDFKSYIFIIKELMRDKVFIVYVIIGSVSFYGISLYDLCIESIVKEINQLNFSQEKISAATS